MGPVPRTNYYGSYLKRWRLGLCDKEDGTEVKNLRPSCARHYICNEPHEDDEEKGCGSPEAGCSRRIDGLHEVRKNHLARREVGAVLAQLNAGERISLSSLDAVSC